MKTLFLSSLVLFLAPFANAGTPDQCAMILNRANTPMVLTFPVGSRSSITSEILTKSGWQSYSQPKALGLDHYEAVLLKLGLGRCRYSSKVLLTEKGDAQATLIFLNAATVPDSTCPTVDENISLESSPKYGEMAITGTELMAEHHYMIVVSPCTNFSFSAYGIDETKLTNSNP